MQNAELIRYLQEAELLRDSFIESITMNFSGHMSFLINLTTQSGKSLKINFRGVSGYLFFDNEESYERFLISHYKLFQIDKGFYFSFDPFSEIGKIESEDNNYIIFSEISLA